MTKLKESILNYVPKGDAGILVVQAKMLQTLSPAKSTLLPVLLLYIVMPISMVFFQLLFKL